MKNQTASQSGSPAPARLRIIDAERFGPWAVVTGASSGIGKEFARQLAAHGLNLVLVARRLAELEALGKELAQQYGVECRSLMVDLSRDDAATAIEDATREIDVGLVVSNAGTGMPGEFLASSKDDLHAIVRLNAIAQLDLTHHFGRRLAARKRGGLLLVGASGASEGIPMMANPGATKAFVHSLGEALHLELAKYGVSVTVLKPGLTDTPVLEKFGIQNPPMKPTSVEQCVSEGLHALNASHSSIVPGRLLRIMGAMVPASAVRSMTMKMLTQALEAKAAKALGPKGKAGDAKAQGSA